jgi:hypothetical protein
MPDVERRCIWCGSSEHIKEVRFNRQDRVTVPFCSDACEASARKFLEFDAKYSGSFYVVEAILTVACLTLVFARDVFYAGVIATGMGLLILPFPFLAAVLGGRTYIKRSILMARVVGVLIIFAGGVAAAFI